MQIPNLQKYKRFTPLIVAIVSGLAAVFLINVYIQQRADEARRLEELKQKNLITVVIARQDISSGVAVKENMVKEETVNKALVQPRAATSLDRVIDKITIAPIAKGEQILLNKLTASGLEVSLSNKIPRGKRAITIPVDNISSVGGMIRPGDHVDIVGMVPIPTMGADGKTVNQLTTMPLFQDVLVLAVGQEYTPVPGGERGERKLSPIITLALTPQEASLVAFVQEQGRIRLVLRSPEDTGVQNVPPASWDTLFRLVMPQMFVEKPTELPKPQKKVEIYRGLQKEVKILEE